MPQGGELRVKLSGALTLSAVLPDTVENTPVGLDLEQVVVRGDIVEVGALGVEEVSAGDPDLVDRLSVQCDGVARVKAGSERRECEARVDPVLPQVDIEREVLEKSKFANQHEVTASSPPCLAD